MLESKNAEGEEEEGGEKVMDDNLVPESVIFL